ncbi:phospholipase [Bacillus cereus]|uniref:Phospholipase C n=1 Tax=Bacillus cereus TaxID=1396 RepID=A0A9X7CDM9_BACCE|nr:zinc dependent phospholipase C family protein [Bacillus cereus]OUB23763.1 hypothetical protein BK708_16110 [Bacillus thuringiensis serovar yunnanensis]PGO78917.1 phospholipase [Bacillus cereus]
MKLNKKLRQIVLATALTTTAITAVPSETLGWSAEHPNVSQQNTHKWIADRALDIIALDQSTKSRKDATDFFIHPQIVRAFEQGLYDADHLNEFNDGGVGKIYIDAYINGGWKSHFYDPDTGTNYKGETTPTAKTEGTKYFERAGEYYQNNNHERAAYYLGVATHYFTDVTQPMHAANFTNVDTLNNAGFHSQFENYVTEIQDHYKVEDALGDYNILLANNNTEYSYNPDDWIHAAAIIAKAEASNIIGGDRTERGRVGYGVSLPSVSIVEFEQWKNDPDTQLAIARSLIEAQRITAGFLNMFFEKFAINNDSGE